jgi:glyoxylase-like metal-dependent hydrolase (beta-lactamase superfamily II)
MATAAEPRPASLPLPGGRDGATVRLRPLLCGTMASPPAALHRERGRLASLRALGVGVPRERWVTVPVVAFLVEHPGAGTVLVDTGFHPSVAVAPHEAFGRLAGTVIKDVHMDPGQAVPAQLRELGLAPADVSTVVMTHLHSDHASGIAEFPAPTFVVAAAEWAAAGASGRTKGYWKRWFDHAFDWRTLDFESSDAGSFASFGRSYDLFGDGSVRVVSTPGHTEGHLSVVLRLRGREALLTGDAAYTRRTLAESALPYRMVDEHRFRRSLREIQLYTRQTPDALVVCGHDMGQWRELEEVYE